MRSKQRKAMFNGKIETVTEIDLRDICSALEEFHSMMHDLFAFPQAINSRAHEVDNMAAKFQELFPEVDGASAALFVAGALIQLVKTKRDYDRSRKHEQKKGQG